MVEKANYKQCNQIVEEFGARMVKKLGYVHSYGFMTGLLVMALKDMDAKQQKMTFDIMFAMNDDFLNDLAESLSGRTDRSVNGLNVEVDNGYNRYVCSYGFMTGLLVMALKDMEAEEKKKTFDIMFDMNDDFLNDLVESLSGRTDLPVDGLNVEVDNG